VPNYAKPDFWAVKAQKEGYPARSVYKLAEIDEKFGLLRGLGRQRKILDLGAAPGSWSLYVLRKVPGTAATTKAREGGFALAACDIAPLSRQYDKGLFDSEAFFFVQADMTAASTRETLAARGPYGLLLSDAAPATTGARFVDTQRSLALAETALGLAETLLAPNGALVIKVFQGEESAALLERAKVLFKTARTFKPASCRPSSFETYLVGLNRR
jgi:23S rRNA (uridine2552-2'-O)-methyltransferase